MSVVTFFFCYIDFSIIWKYVGIGNQILATVEMWTATGYLIKKKKPHWMCSPPATFLTFVCISYFMVAPIVNGGLHLPPVVGNITGVVGAIAVFFTVTRTIK